MQVIITAVGPDNRGLADPIVHHVSTSGANIAEIQMYDHDELKLFAMLLRINMDSPDLDRLRKQVTEIGGLKNLSIRVWSPDERADRPRLAICTTYRPEPALALLRAIRDGQMRAEPAVMIGNRTACRGIAEQFGVPWVNIGDDKGNPDDERLMAVCDEHQVDYVILARYMRVLPAASCWSCDFRTERSALDRPASRCRLYTSRVTPLASSSRVKVNPLEARQSKLEPRMPWQRRQV